MLKTNKVCWYTNIFLKNLLVALTFLPVGLQRLNFTKPTNQQNFLTLLYIYNLYTIYLLIIYIINNY